MNEDLQPEKRGPGRPSKDEAPVIKKGKPTWKPADVDEIFDKEPGYRYRRIAKDQRNLAKKEAEGWEILSDVAGAKTKMEAGYGRINDGKPLTSVREGYDYVLGRIPEDSAQARDKHFNAKTARQMAGLKREADQSIKGAPVHGSITMEKKGIRTVIKE